MIANSNATEEKGFEEESNTDTVKKNTTASQHGYNNKRLKHDVVIRYPKFSQSKDPEKYYLNLLRLYFPQRKEISSFTI